MRPKSSTPETPSERSDGCEFDGCEVVGCEFVVSRCDAPTLLEFVKKPFDQIARAIQIRAEADRLLAIALRRNVCPCTLLAGERPDPIRIISSIGQQRRSWMQLSAISTHESERAA